MHEPKCRPIVKNAEMKIYENDFPSSAASEVDSAS